MKIISSKYDLGNYFIVSPAYGRDYQNEADAKMDFEDGKDFTCESLNLGGYTYCSIRDFQPNDKVEIRFRKKGELIIYTVN